MPVFKSAFAIGVLLAASAIPVFAQDAAPAQATQITDPTGDFVDEFGTSFKFALCGDSGTDLCGTLTNLEGESATEENLAFVGKMVMQAKLSAPNQWKGSISAGGMSADATITQTGPDTVEIQGCRAILCQTLAYHRAS